MTTTRRLTITLGSLALLAGCTQGSSQIETAATLPRPQVVVVQDFAVCPGEVQLDPGLSGTIDETLGGNQLPPRPAKEQQVGRQVADALAEKLVVEIRDLGLRAERGMGLPPGAPPGWSSPASSSRSTRATGPSASPSASAPAAAT